MKELTKERAAEIIRTVLSELPRKLALDKNGKAVVSNGMDDMHEVMTGRQARAFLTVRFEDMESVSILYLSADGRCLSVDEMLVDEFDRTKLVADFSRKFGWVDDLHGDMDKALTERQLAVIDAAAANTVTLLSHAPSVIYCGRSPIFSLQEADYDNGFFLTIDIGIANDMVAWMSSYMTDVPLHDVTDEEIAFAMGGEGKVGHVAKSDGEMMSAILFLGDATDKPLPKEVIAQRMRDMFLIDINKSGRRRSKAGPREEQKGEFAITFLRDPDAPMVPECLGISKERYTEFFIHFKELMGSHKSDEEIFERTTGMCQSKEELFFAGWLLGSTQMNEFIHTIFTAADEA